MRRIMSSGEANQAVNVGNEAIAEVQRAMQMFRPIYSPHEAHGVILEELDEFWDEVKAFNPYKNRDTRPKMRAELIQVAAMAIRAIIDVIDNGKVYGANDGQGQDRRVDAVPVGTINQSGEPT